MAWNRAIFVDVILENCHQIDQAEEAETEFRARQEKWNTSS
jgi:hypothetical protein